MASYNQIMQDNLDLVFRAGGLGSRRAAAYEMLFGLNYRARGQVVPAQRDQVGLTFFTRPDLNLHRDNVTQDRTLTDLISTDEITYPRAIRAILDPVGSSDPNFDYSCKLVNPRNPFMCVLTNTLKSVSGFPDNAIGKYTSNEGIAGEQWGMADGYYNIRGNYQLTASFANVDGSPVLRLFDVWERYMENIRTKKMKPWSRNIYRNRMDYTTRIYRLILDPGRRFVQQIGATGYAFPITNPRGGVMNFDADDNYDRSTDLISIQFDAYGAIYDDPLLIRQFNKVVAMFNPDLRIINETSLNKSNIAVKSNNYYRVTPDQREYLNYYCYPLIHPYTRELCWFIEKPIYDLIMANNYAVPNYDYNALPNDTDDTYTGYQSNVWDTFDLTKSGDN